MPILADEVILRLYVIGGRESCSGINIIKSSVSSMFAYRLLVLVSLILVVTILTSEAERAKSDLFKYRRNRQAKHEMRQYCGRRLSSTVQMICGSVYNSRFKKSNQEMDPYKTVENAKKMLKTRRNPRGIYEECCLRSCTRDELSSYCANP
ncbi:insulin-like peptide 2 isoform X2 [Halictus rubicundus]|uniref:insulin-like peptide 2 isoform X2 n=1 Tax=Halictus rubicundus TaxID=77578 RepID=UPI004034F802